MFGDVVLDVPKKKFEHIFDGVKAGEKVKFDYELGPEALKKIIVEYKKLVKKETGKDFPQDPLDQLVEARDAVFRSWQNERAKTYRRINRIDDWLGTAVNVQAMVFGNLGENSGTGVGFTRNPATGEHMFFGEYLMNAQGEDVVSGVRTPLPISELEKAMPKVYEHLRDITRKMEKHYRDMQDFEFTIQDGKLYMLQTRNGKRTGLAAVRVAIDMVREGLITQEEAILPRRAQPALRLPGSAAGGKGREDRSAGHRPAGFARRGRGPDRVHRRGSREAPRRAAPTSPSSWCAAKPRLKTLPAWKWRPAF